MADIRQKALSSGGQERLGLQSKALVSAGGARQSSTALAQRKLQSIPKPQWHPPWKLMRVRKVTMIVIQKVPESLTLKCPREGRMDPSCFFPIFF